MSERAKRPPRQVWLTIPIDSGSGKPGVHLTLKAAKADKWENEVVVGPYVLAERVAQK